MNADPLVSIIIPTFNRYDFLKETVTNILAQTYTNIEVIIVSDNSTDETTSLQEFITDERCHLYQLPQKSNGPAAVRNFGLSKCKGSLIAFCDDDDVWLPTKLQKQVNAILADPELAIVATNVKYYSVNKNLLTYTASLKGFLNSLNFIPRKYIMAFYNCIVLSSAMVRKSYLSDNPFNEADEYQGHEDVDLWLRLCSAYKAIILPEYLTIYRVHPTQISTASNKAYKKQSLKILKNNYPNFNFLEKTIAGFRIAIYNLFGY